MCIYNKVSSEKLHKQNLNFVLPLIVNIYGKNKKNVYIFMCSLLPALNICEFYIILGNTSSFFCLFIVRGKY